MRVGGRLQIAGFRPPDLGTVSCHWLGRRHVSPLCNADAVCHGRSDRSARGSQRGGVGRAAERSKAATPRKPRPRARRRPSVLGWAGRSPSTRRGRRQADGQPRRSRWAPAPAPGRAGRLGRLYHAAARWNAAVARDGPARSRQDVALLAHRARWHPAPRRRSHFGGPRRRRVHRPWGRRSGRRYRQSSDQPARPRVSPPGTTTEGNEPPVTPSPADASEGLPTLACPACRETAPRSPRRGTGPACLLQQNRSPPWQSRPNMSSTIRPSSLPALQRWHAEGGGGARPPERGPAAPSSRTLLCRLVALTSRANRRVSPVPTPHARDTGGADLGAAQPGDAAPTGSGESWSPPTTARPGNRAAPWSSVTSS